MFNHERLEVYVRVLAFNAIAQAWIEAWPAKHAIRDQLDRAAASALENLALASASFSGMKIRSLEYAIGSVLECAACLDIARVKQLEPPPIITLQKRELAQTLSMLMGLRRSWLTPSSVRESGADYQTVAASADHEPLFRHEQLDVYIVALEAMAQFVQSESMEHLPLTTYGSLDTLLTSLLLNIAEGNGRFSAQDQRRFLGMAHEATVRLAAKLDVVTLRHGLAQNEVMSLKQRLARVATMTVAMVHKRSR